MKRYLILWVGSFILLAGCGSASLEVNAITPTKAQPRLVLDSDDATSAAPATPETAASGAPVPVAPVVTQEAEQPPMAQNADPSFETFRQSVIDTIVAKDVNAMAALMANPHTIAFWRSEGMSFPPAEAAADLVDNRMPAGSSVAFSAPPANLSNLLDGMDPRAMFGPDVQVVEVLYSTGWGVDGAGDALVYIITQPNGSFAWYATLIAHGSFASTADVGPNTLADAQQKVQNAITARDLNLMAQTMTEPFLIAYWQSEGVVLTRVEAASNVLNFAPTTNRIEFFQDVPPELETALASDMEHLWGPEANPVDTMYSTGWGEGGNGEAILVFTKSPEGLYAWYGILLAPGGF